MGKLWLKKNKTKQNKNKAHYKQRKKHSEAESRTWIICTRLPRITLSGKIIYIWNSAGRRFLKLVQHWKIYLRKMGHNYLLLLLTFRPPFPPSSSSEWDIHQHLLVTGFVKIKTLSLRWLTWSELHSESLFSELLSKRLSSRSCLKFRRRSDDRNWIYSSATEVISDANLFVSPLRGTLAKSVRAFHTRWRNLC